MSRSYISLFGSGGDVLPAAAGGGRSDNFNRGDTTNAIGTPSDGGSAWSQLSGTWGISSNQGYNSSGGSQEICVLESSQSNVSVEAVCSPNAGSMGLVIRCTDNTNYFVLIVTGSGIELWMNDDGFTQLDAFVGTVNNGDTIRVDATSGNVITGYQNDVQRVTATNSFNSTATLHGMRCHSTTAPRFDDFSITTL